VSGAKSILLSTLATKFSASDVETFKASYPHDWLVWEPGQWRPPARTTVLLAPDPAHPPPREGESLAFALEPKEQLTVGRGEDCDVSINDATLSQTHLVLRRRAPSGWTVRDAGSTNGTVVDGALVPAGKPVDLKSGARIQAGGVTLTFYVPAGLLMRLRSR